MDLAAIDALLSRARSRQSANRIGDLDAKILTLQGQITEANAQIESVLMEQKTLREATNICSAKIVELQSLKEFIELSEYESAQASLHDKQQTYTAEINKIDQSIKEQEELVEMLTKDLTSLQVDRKKFAADIPASEAPKAAPIIAARTADSLRLIRDKEVATDDAMVHWAKTSGLANRLHGLRVAFYGGVAGRDSAQAVKRFLDETCQVKRSVWYESDSGKNEANMLMQSIKSGTLDVLILFNGYNVPAIVACAQTHKVRVVRCSSITKKTVLSELANSFGFHFDVSVA